MKAVKIFTIVGLVSFVFFSFTTIIQDKWVVPAKYVTMKNPVPAKTDAAVGKSLYDKHCKSCHGKEGYGDGPKADGL